MTVVSNGIDQDGKKLTTYRCRVTMIASGWQGMSVFRSGEFVHKSPSKTSLVGESVNSAIHQQASQQRYIPKSSCLVSGVSREYSRDSNG